MLIEMNTIIIVTMQNTLKSNSCEARLLFIAYQPALWEPTTLYLAKLQLPSLSPFPGVRRVLILTLCKLPLLSWLDLWFCWSVCVPAPPSSWPATVKPLFFNRVSHTSHTSHTSYCFRRNLHVNVKPVPQHTHGGAGGRGGKAPTHLRPRH
jgi:hypothetical protein